MKTRAIFFLKKSAALFVATLGVCCGFGAKTFSQNAPAAPTTAVAQPSADPHLTPSFRLDVMPILAKAGCNTGGCHGAARGKDGFHLSLFGYDADGDYFSITRQMSARRVNLALPRESLLLQKATGSVPHTGGKRFAIDSEMYNTLLHWLENGAPNDPPNVATPVAVELSPKEILLEGAGATKKLSVRCRYSDGTTRDVTKLAVFFSNNDATAKVSDDGTITAGERVEHQEAFVMARFATFTEGVQTIVVPAAAKDEKNVAYVFPNVPETNYIDTLIDNKLRKLRIAPSELCSDEEFLRRVSIDVVGLLPDAAEHDRFVADPDPQKRAKLIDTLLARKEFIDIWVMKWAELLQIRSNNDVSFKSALVYFDWLKDKLAQNVPINEIARELVAASGGTFENPAASFYQFETDPLKLAEDTAQSFLGIRMQCAQCHNHPFDRWTMNDYRGFVGFFAQVGHKKGEDPRETIVFNKGEGESKNPVTNKNVAPKFLGGETPKINGEDRRKALADWLAGPDNPYFARHMANVIWAQFFGRGIIEPVDDVRVSNPASNPELLDALAKKLVASNFDFKALVRDICNSRTYQLSSRANETNESDARNFSHSAVRRLRAEVMLDCISEVTESKNKFHGLPIGARAVEIADGQTSSYFLKTFGRASRETVCTCEVSMEPNLSQALHLLNGDTVQQKINNGAALKNLLAQLSQQKIAPREIVENLYLRCFTRRPTDDEVRNLEPLFAKPEDQPKVLADVFWALLNSKEFMFNH